MADRAFTGTYFVKTPPDIELADGLVHIGYDISPECRFEVVLTPHVYLKAMRRARQVADEFHESGRVEPMRRKRGH